MSDFDLNYWNKKIYKDENDKFVEGGLRPKDFWEEFGIKSHPIFRGECYSHIPERWADEVRSMIKKAQKRLGDRIKFIQIKEKFCHLTVYFDSSDEEAKKEFLEIKKECVDNLRNKNLHP